MTVKTWRNMFKIFKSSFKQISCVHLVSYGLGMIQCNSKMWGHLTGGWFPRWTGPAAVVWLSPPLSVHFITTVELLNSMWKYRRGDKHLEAVNWHGKSLISIKPGRSLAGSVSSQMTPHNHDAVIWTRPESQHNCKPGQCTGASQDPLSHVHVTQQLFLSVTEGKKRT